MLLYKAKYNSENQRMNGENDITELTNEELEEFIRPPDPIKREQLIDDFTPSWHNREETSTPKDEDFEKALQESFNDYYNKDHNDVSEIDLEEEKLIAETIQESLRHENLPLFVDDEKIIEEIIKESLKPENIAPLLEEEKEKRMQMCTELMKFLERTKKYVLDNELVYNVLTDFCGEGSFIDLEYEVFIRFQKTLLTLVAGGKLYAENANYILSTINVVCDDSV